MGGSLPYFARSIGLVATILAMTAGRLSAAGCPGISASTSTVEVSPVEPGETFVETRHFSFMGLSACDGQRVQESGTLSAFAGPAGGEYVIADGSAFFSAAMRGDACIFNIGCFSGASGSLQYALSVSAPAGRPARHWDASYTETLSGRSSFVVHWTIHIGESFADVPRSDPFYRKVETLLHNGITTGCSLTDYCPGQNIASGALAMILSRALAGGGANVAESGTVRDVPYDCTAGGVSLFSDVAPTDAVCKHVHYLAAQNVTIGCSATELCPSAPVTRGEIAEFVAQAIVAPGGDAAIPEHYLDSVTSRRYNCTPATPNLHFTDVSATDPLCRPIHYLWAKGMINGCSPTGFCPDGEVTRDQMAKFVVDGFDLRLP
jgi:hypothetical protein